MINNVYVHITHGDITTLSGVKGTNILASIGNFVRRYAKSNHFHSSHFQEIIHILDMDGAYIPDSAIVEDLTVKNTIYFTNKIRTSKVTEIKNRNKTKSECLERISTSKCIWNIPYQAYYMSCNLDHVLYDKQNSNDDDKEKDALSFVRKYRNNLKEFVSFISESDFSVTGDYIGSWKFIKQELHSLERHTNLGICLKKAIMNN